MNWPDNRQILLTTDMSRKAEALTFTICETCLGWIGVVGSPDGLKKVILPLKSKEAVLDQVKRCGCEAAGHHSIYFADLANRIRRYFDGEPVEFADKLDLSGTTRFQRDVWRTVRNIPRGQTRSYGWVASQLGLTGGARAVGQALGRNPLPIVIPCHRVIGSDGKLGGF
ncbi:MAG: methylated-DNA--[protein]-cysteine S-methyltransferase, partial [Dehalococcoidia bacterium]|nr:methylated-DNA--[protein]-cysteine S-methyltransferase [Dehalococcoidia bacterium]